MDNMKAAMILAVLKMLTAIAITTTIILAMVTMVVTMTTINYEDGDQVAMVITVAAMVLVVVALLITMHILALTMMFAPKMNKTGRAEDAF